MYVCMYICMYVCMYVCMYMYMYSYICKYSYIYGHTHTHTCIYMPMYTEPYIKYYKYKSYNKISGIYYIDKSGVISTIIKMVITWNPKLIILCNYPPKTLLLFLTYSMKTIHTQHPKVEYESQYVVVNNPNGPLLPLVQCDSYLEIYSSIILHHQVVLILICMYSIP